MELFRWRCGVGRVCGVLQQCVEGGAVVEVAVGDHGVDLADVVDVGERIGVEEDEVGEFAFGDRALGGLGAEEFRGIAGGGLQRFHRSESGFDEVGEFIVEAEAGEDEDPGRGIGAGEKRHAGVVHVGDHFQIAREIFFAKRRADLFAGRASSRRRSAST